METSSDMTLVIKNRKFRGNYERNRSNWALMDGSEKKYGWHRVPTGIKEEAFVKVVNKLDWEIYKLERIAIKAKAPQEIGLILKGICQDSKFERKWENLSELDFKDMISGLYSYYLSEMMD